MPPQHIDIRTIFGIIIHIIHRLTVCWRDAFMGRKKIVESSAEKSRRSHLAIMMRAGRTALGFSQREFGELVGVHYSSLARFETGQLRLKPLHIETMLNFLANSGLHIEISKENGINIQIPPHILGEMEAIEGIKISAASYEATELVGL